MMYTHLPRGYSSYISSFHEYQDDVTGRTQIRPFEERIYGCSQGCANLCGANARPTGELSLARGRGGEQHL